MQDYRILKYLGDGGFASVFLTQHRKLGKVAYKKFAALNLPDSDWTQIRKEAKIQMRLRHPNVVSMFEAQFTSPDIGLFLEYMQYGSVDTFIREYTVTWEWKTQILYDVSLAMAHLHQQKPVIIHGDLKSQNILIGDGYRAKISDFGLSRTIQALSSVEIKDKLRGTIEYIAPEYLDDFYRKKTEKFDVYGYGITAWEIYSQKSFFKTFFDKQIIGVHVRNGKRPEMVDIRDSIPASITELMTQCWHQENDSRPSFETIRDLLFSQISSNLFALQLPSKIKRPKHDMEDSSCQHPIDQADFISSGVHEQSRAKVKFITGLKKVQSSIAEYLDPFNGLLVCLRERGILERDETDKLNQFVNETTSHIVCNKRILSEYVLPKIEYCCKEFIEALKDNDQEHIVNFIMKAGEHLDRVLSKEEIRIIDNNMSSLVNLINPYKMGFLDLLVSENCITSRQREIVEKMATNQEKIAELMKVLKLRNYRHFQNFKLCLNETKQGKLANVLVEGQGVIAVHVTLDKNKNISKSKLIDILTTHLNELNELDGSPTMEQITLKNQLNELTGLGVDFVGVCNSDGDGSIVNYFQCSSSRSVKKFSQALESGQLNYILENMYRCLLQIHDTKSALIKHVTSDTNIPHVKHLDNLSRIPGESSSEDELEDINDNSRLLTGTQTRESSSEYELEEINENTRLLRGTRKRPGKCGRTCCVVVIAILVTMLALGAMTGVIVGFVFHDKEMTTCSCNPCQNGGRYCSEPNANNTCVCSCPSGFSGKYCQNNINECASCPCPNFQSCVDLVNGYMCKSCPAGYTGVNCEIRLRDSTFYPFGPSSNDLTLPAADDTFIEVTLSFDFPFFGQRSRKIFLTTNGLITFVNSTSVYIPRPFPLTNMIGLAPYWTDSDPRQGGKIYYRDERNSTVLQQIKDDVISLFPQFRPFPITGALVFTFDNVPAFGCSGGSCGANCNAVLKYQAILSTDGTNSVATFLYNRLDYTAGSTNCNAHAQIGFNAGDGRRYYMVPSSNTVNIKNMAIQQSNVNIPKKWMFSVAEESIAGGCIN